MAEFQLNKDGLAMETVLVTTALSWLSKKRKKSNLLEWLWSKVWVIITVGEDMKNLETSCTTGRNLK